MGIILLSTGATLTAVSLFLEWYRNQLVILGVLILSVPFVGGFILLKFMKLYRLTIQYENTDNQNRLVVKGKIADLSAENPKWIMVSNSNIQYAVDSVASFKIIL